MSIHKTLKKLIHAGAFLPSFFLLTVFPASTNFRLDSYGFGAGGEASMSSQTYSLEGIAGETSASQSSANYSVKSGLQYEQESNVPVVTLSNDSNWYNKLNLVIDAQNNPADVKFAVAVSDDDWATTQWVQNDGTVGANLGFEDYQTYTEWGGVSGSNIIGLSPDTTYRARAKAVQGFYTESALGPESSVATSPVTMAFDIDVSTSDSESSPPYDVSMGDLTIGGVTTASQKIWLDLSTNADSGGFIYIYDANGGLHSANTDYTITSATADLSGASEGFGVQAANVANLIPQSPFNGSSEAVGVLSSTIRELFNSGGDPVSGGRGSLTLKVKTSNTTPASNDYSDTITIIASGDF
jgi:hypothetical protein